MEDPQAAPWESTFTLQEDVSDRLFYSVVFNDNNSFLTLSRNEISYLQPTWDVPAEQQYGYSLRFCQVANVNTGV